MVDQTQGIVSPEVVGADEKRKLARPTLLVGLGGTGREILLRIRQSFVEQYGVPGLPAIAYLWVDCDPQSAQDVQNKPYDWLLPNAELAPDEKVAATVSQATIEAYMNNRNQHPWLFSWIYPQVFEFGPILSGASQVRPRGRLGFYENFASIRNLAEGKIDQVMSVGAARETQEKYGVRVADDMVQVYIICSLAGGTGGGMFLDNAFMFRRMLKAKVATSSTVGYLVLPSVYAPPNTARRIYANAYAALMELEHFGLAKDIRASGARDLDAMLAQYEATGSDDAFKGLKFDLDHSRHDFLAYWDRQGQPARLRGPAFDYCYLIDNASEGGLNLTAGRITDLFDMVAESIVAEYSGGPYASQKRSARDNIMPKLTESFLKVSYQDSAGEQIYEESFSKLYSSLGFARLQVPVMQMRSACASRLALEMLGVWLEEKLPGPDMQQQLRKNAPKQLGFRAEDYLAALDRKHDGSSYTQTVTQWRVQVEDQLKRKATEPQLQLSKLLDAHFGKFRGDALRFDPNEPATNWGHVPQMLESNGPRKADDLRREVRQQTGQWLETLGVPLTEDYLLALRKVIEEESARIRKQTDISVQQRKGVEQAYDGVLNALAGEEASGRHRSSALELALFGVEHAADWIVLRARELVLERAAEINDALAEFVEQSRESDEKEGERVTTGGLVKDVAEFKARLADMRTSFRGLLERFDRDPDHEIFQYLYARGDYEEYYRRQAIDLDKEQRDLFSSLGIAGLLGLMDRVASQGPGSTSAEINKYCAGRFRDVKLEADVIKTLHGLRAQGRIGADEWRQVIERFVKTGTPWLKASGSAASDALQSAAYYALGLYQQGTGDAYQDFYRVLDEALGQALKGVQGGRGDTPRDSVLLYSERGAFPLMYVNNISEYRRCYLDELGQTLSGGAQGTEGFYPHITRRDSAFHDICKMSDAEAHDLRRAHESVLLGVVLRHVIVRAKGDDSFLSVKLTREETPLGYGRSLAVSTLLGRRDILDKLQAGVARDRAAMSLRERQEFAAALMRLLDTTFPIRFMQTKFGPRPVFSLDRDIIADAVDEELALVAQGLQTDVRGAEERVEALMQDIDEFTDAQDIGGGAMVYVMKADSAR